jgi:hypothetical protein
LAGKQHDRPYRRDEDDEDNEADVQAFQGRHRSFSDRLERFLMQLVILGLVGLVLVQTLQVIPGLRRQMSLVDALEGVTPNERSAWSGASGPATTAAQPLTVTVVLASQRSAPEALLLVDGKAVGNFAGGSVTATVKPGQVVAVDGTGYSQALIFRVVGALGVATPEIGLTVTTHRNQQRLGDVRAGK